VSVGREPQNTKELLGMPEEHTELQQCAGATSISDRSVHSVTDGIEETDDPPLVRQIPVA
jgi:hypothetical protein